MAATISPVWRTRDALAHSDITALCFVRLAQPAIPGSRPARQNLSPASRVQNIKPYFFCKYWQVVPVLSTEWEFWHFDCIADLRWRIVVWAFMAVLLPEQDTSRLTPAVSLTLETHSGRNEWPELRWHRAGPTSATLAQRGVNTAWCVALADWSPEPSR